MTVKGYGTSEAGEASNETHSLKKLDLKSLKAFRDRFGVPISDKDLKDVPFYRPPEDSPEMRYLRERRAELGGSIPSRRATSYSLPAPGAVRVREPAKGQR
jgi:pyruvate dehydrogenase E1 component